MDQIEEIPLDLVPYKNEQCIQIKLRDSKLILTNQVSLLRLFQNRPRRLTH